MASKVWSQSAATAHTSREIVLAPSPAQCKGSVELTRSVNISITVSRGGKAKRGRPGVGRGKDSVDTIKVPPRKPGFFSRVPTSAI
jgi:hypothetical protein